MDTQEGQEEGDNIAKGVAGYLKSLSTDVVAEIHVHGLSGALALAAARWWKMDPEEVFVLLAVIALIVAALFATFRCWLRRRRAARQQAALTQKPAPVVAELAVQDSTTPGSDFRGYM